MGSQVPLGVVRDSVVTPFGGVLGEPRETAYTSVTLRKLGDVQETKAERFPKLDVSAHRLVFRSGHKGRRPQQRDNISTGHTLRTQASLIEANQWQLLIASAPVRIPTSTSNSRPNELVACIAKGGGRSKSLREYGSEPLARLAQIAAGFGEGGVWAVHPRRSMKRSVTWTVCRQTVNLSCLIDILEASQFSACTPQSACLRVPQLNPCRTFQDPQNGL